MSQLEVITKLKKCPKIKSISITEDKKLLLRWSKVEGAEKYSVRRAVSDTGEFEHLAWCKKPEYLDEAVGEDITYRYKIMAYKKLEGKKSSTKLSPVRAAVISDIPPVEKLTAQTRGASIRLCWERAQADEYIVSRRNDLFSQLLPIARTCDTEFTDKKTVYGQLYIYSVQPVIKQPQGERQGNFSNEVRCVNLDKGSILDIKSLLGRGRAITLRIVSGADYYILERAQSPEGPFTQVLKSGSALDYYLLDRSASVFRRYYYRACAVRLVDGEEIRSPYCEVSSTGKKRK